MFDPLFVQEIYTGGAIVFADENFDPKIRNAYAFNIGGPAGVTRIVDGHLISNPSSNMEILPTLLLQQLRFHYRQRYKLRVTVYSDCQSNIKIVYIARKAYRYLSTSISSLAKILGAYTQHISTS